MASAAPWCVVPMKAGIAAGKEDRGPGNPEIKGVSFSNQYHYFLP
ncbi:MAG: hypothetical protein PHH09_02545 [Methanoregulaceae archaeon]|nr:hypothetical protein [Methanoregulaceae archaeon]